MSERARHRGRAGATTPGHETHVPERDFLGSIRVSFAGTKEVVAYELQSAHKYLKTLLADGDTLPQIAWPTVISTVKAWGKDPHPF